MMFFPLIFSTAIAAAHLYLFWNLRRAFGPGLWQYFAAAVIAAFMLCSIYRSRVAYYAKSQLVVDILFLWVGLVLLVTLWTAARDGAHIAAILLGKLTHRAPPFFFSRRLSFQIALALGAAAFVYSLHEARNLTVETLTVKTDRLSASEGKLRIVALTDLHLTRNMNPTRLDEVIRLTDAQRPDLVLLLGDTVDDRIEDQEQLWSRLRQLRAPKGKFAVLGNHEFYRGMEQALVFLDKSGFATLRGAYVDTGGIRIVGVDDPAIRSRKSIPATLEASDSDRFILFLAHRPETPSEALGRFDLQLSGHTHGGQVWPVRYLTWLLNGHPQGLRILNERDASRSRRSSLYLSNGTGYWGPPVRFLTPPEITVIDIQPK